MKQTTKTCIEALNEKFGNKDWKRVQKSKSYSWITRIFYDRDNPYCFGSVVTKNDVEIDEVQYHENLPKTPDELKRLLVDYCNSQEFIDDWLSVGSWQSYEEMLGDSNVTQKDLDDCRIASNWVIDSDNINHYPKDQYSEGSWHIGFSNSKSEIYRGWVILKLDGSLEHCYTEND